MLLCTWSASLNGNILAQKYLLRVGDVLPKLMMEYSNLHRSLIVSHTLTDFEIKSYYKCENKHAGVYSQKK